MTESPRIAVLAPTPLAVVEATPATAEQARSAHGAGVHIHPGGQGPWMARMAVSLGATVRLVGPFGGELGPLIQTMLEDIGLEIAPVAYPSGNGGYIYELRNGEREVLAHMPPPVLSRHESDDLYGLALVEALDADLTVVTGSEPDDVLAADFYGRFVTDARASGAKVLADISGDAALAVIDAGVDVLKMAHDEMLEAGLAKGESKDALVTGAKALIKKGVGAVVVSRADQPALAIDKDGYREYKTPPVTTHEHRGAGDSMTAAVAVALARGDSFTDAVRLGAAAGALNVTRGGLGTGDRSTIERIADHIEVSSGTGR